MSDSATSDRDFPSTSDAHVGAHPTAPRANVLGVGISAINLETAWDLIVEAAQRRRKGYVTVTGVHGVSEAQKDPDFKRILNQSFLCTPDGMPMSWVGWVQGYKTMDRVYGPDLMLGVSERSVALGLRHFYYGGKEGVAELLKQRMEDCYPGLQVVGTYCPPFRPLTQAEERDLQARIEHCRPDFFWIGLSTPKQERFAAAFTHRLNATLLLSVGAAFDFHAGLVPQAPAWMQRAGLEWLYRLGKEPKRLWRRYLVNNPLFLWRIALQLSGRRTYVLDAAEPDSQ